MNKTAALIMLITIVSQIFGFGREIALSFLYGTSSTSDAYLISTTIPGVLFGIITAGLVAGYIPMYSKVAKEDGESEANKFTNNLISILLVICSAIVLIGLIFTEQIVKVFAYGFEGETLNLAVKFTKISLFAIYLSAMISIFTGYLQIKNNYIIPALVGIPFNFIVVLSIVLSHKTNTMALPLGFVIASVSQLILMIPYIRKSKYRYKFKIDFKDKNIKNLAYIMLPIILGISVNQINVLIDRTLASQLAVGGISALNYANRLNGFVQGIFVMSITSVLYPNTSKMAAENNMNGLKSALSRAITGINLLVIPATLGAIVLAEPIVTVLFGRGEFDIQATAMTSNALIFYSIGMVGFGFREILSRTFYSLQDTKTPMINAAIGMFMNIILNIILSRFLGIGGLALATSISAIFTSGLMFISLKRKIGSYGLKQLSISFIKILCASLLMGVIVKLSFNYLTSTISNITSLFIAIGVGAVSYFVIVNFMRIEDVNTIVKAFKRKLVRK
ncbi:murein biosynthesis integral membrane protein MurJ [Aquibacillus salsiterrae]|uniref:Probable lipid II flippase MurJ n=1 Tax=Aquibacillus salsiterrae TaxID=2950439 RepID=A0A9X3WDA3_9BACI|nr:murein biosynthesis integral membrane protein MurJ [Aquibacillus salsiterrae]MDC3416598.1 murein biosynthesis integral membrane protein MurJ [Aquibacillus salsiterrae]